MLILACDTSGKSCSVALLDEGKLLYESVNQNLRAHSVNFMPMVEECFLHAERDISEVDLFACVNGPGSFTGIRIGVASVKAFASALNKPCIAVSSLEALSMNLKGGFDVICCPLADARRSQVYCAAFQNENRLFDDNILLIDEFLKKLETIRKNNEKLAFLGDGAEINRAVIIERFKDAVFIDNPNIYAGNVAKIAFKKREAPISAGELKPVYLRLAQAERERLENA